MTTFRVYFTDNTAIDVSASTPNEARDIASARKGGGIVTKVKVLKGA